MSLVAYCDSDISDSDEDNEVYPKEKQEDTTNQPSLVTQIDSLEENNLFKALPLPKKVDDTIKEYEEVDDEFLKKKETPSETPKPAPIQHIKGTDKKPVQIFLPSLSQFETDEDNSTTPKFKPSSKGTGLLSLLPQPKTIQIAEQNRQKNANKFVPNVVKNKAINKKNIEPNKIKTTSKVQLIKYDLSDESDTEEDGMDFFSLNKPQLENNYINNEQDTVADEKGLGSTVLNEPYLNLEHESHYKMNVTEQHQPNENTTNINTQITSYEEQPTQSYSDNLNIDNDALKKLCGSRARHKGETMQIIDINQKEMLPDPREWLTKALTEDTTKRMSSSKRRGDEPTNQQRRKHQITYLAHQAKANEQELQNQWANNRLSKKQTQSKYGF